MNPITESNIKQLLAFIIVILVLCGGVFFLLKFFYPSSNLPNFEAIAPVDVPEPEATQEGEMKNEAGSISYKSNLTLSDIENTTYTLASFPDAKFVNGKFSQGGVVASTSMYAFGDVNNDGSGDAVVVVSQVSGEERLYVVLNTGGLAKSILVSSPPTTGIKITYKNPEIKNGQIIIKEIREAHGFDETLSSSFERAYKFENNKLVNDIKRSDWKTYSNSEFKFQLSYPKESTLDVRAMSDGTRDIPNTLKAAINLPFITTYNTWDKLGVVVYVTKATCPYRNDSTIVEDNGIQFHVYDPSHTKTSYTESSIKMKEYMTYKAPFCYIIISKLEGPGPLSPNFPKPEDVRSPENLDNFFKLQFVIPDQVVGTFKLL